MLVGPSRGVCVCGALRARVVSVLVCVSFVRGGVGVGVSSVCGGQVGDRKVLPKFEAFDTNAFEAVLGTDFFAQNECIKYLSLQEPTHLLVVNEGQEWEAIPLKETKGPRPTLKTVKIFSVGTR